MVSVRTRILIYTRIHWKLSVSWTFFSINWHYYYYWSLLYSAILRSRADSLRSHVILHEWIAFYSAFLNIHRSGVLTALAWLVPQESAARESQSRRVLCTPYNHAPCHFMQSHIRKVYACLAVTCHPHFWQNDRGLLRATAVTRGWNGYRNKSQHRKLTLEKKILPPLQQGFEPATFQSRVRCSNHWAIPAPRSCLSFCVRACVRACVTCVRACVRVCVCVDQRNMHKRFELIAFTFGGEGVDCSTCVYNIEFRLICIMWALRASMSA